MTPLRAISALDDTALMELAARGDSIAFAELFDRHASAAYTLARRIVPPGDAEDVVQEAFVALWRTAHRFDAARGHVRALVTVMVRSRSLDRLRRIGAQQAAIERAELLERTAGPARVEAELLQRDRERDVASALGTLPAEQNRVVRLVYLAGHTHAEVANHLGIPVGTAKGRSRLGLAKLRTPLDEHRPAA